MLHFVTLTLHFVAFTLQTLYTLIIDACIHVARRSGMKLNKPVSKCSPCVAEGKWKDTKVERHWNQVQQQCNQRQRRCHEPDLEHKHEKGMPQVEQSTAQQSKACHKVYRKWNAVYRKRSKAHHQRKKVFNNATNNCMMNAAYSLLTPVLGPKRGLTFGGGLTFGFIHFAVTSPFPTQKMSEPMLLDDLQLEETDTIDEVESSDDSEFEFVEAPVNDEEPEQPEESPSVMELLLDVDEDSTENDAGADENSAEPSKEAPIRLPSFKAKQKPITSWFKSQ